MKKIVQILCLISMAAVLASCGKDPSPKVAEPEVAEKVDDCSDSEEYTFFLSKKSTVDTLPNLLKWIEYYPGTRTISINSLDWKDPNVKGLPDGVWVTLKEKVKNCPNGGKK
jgi:hypothetical protein